MDRAITLGQFLIAISIFILAVSIFISVILLVGKLEEIINVSIQLASVINGS